MNRRNLGPVGVFIVDPTRALLLSSCVSKASRRIGVDMGCYDFTQYDEDVRARKRMGLRSVAMFP